jgi:formylglycine-generating enzyme required for sulfatase activity
MMKIHFRFLLAVILLVQPKPSFAEDYVRFCVGSRETCYKVLKKEVEKFPDSLLALVSSGRIPSETYFKMEQTFSEETQKFKKRAIPHYVLNRIDGKVFGGIVRWIETGSISGIPEDKKDIALEDADYLGLFELVEALNEVAESNVAKFIRIFGGVYTIGSPSSEENRETDERLHNVTLNSYEISETAVTQESYVLITGTNPSYFKEQKYCPESFKEIEVNKMKIPACSDHPVETVSWDEAKQYVKRLSDQDSKFTYSLPTEAQLEVAFRGGSTTAHVSGDGLTLGDYVWYSANSGGQTHSVKSRVPNAYGIYRSSVLEWVSDWYSESYQGGLGIDPTGAFWGPLRVARGGGWDSKPKHCRSAYRCSLSPGKKWDSLGFRLTRKPRSP